MQQAIQMIDALMNYFDDSNSTKQLQCKSNNPALIDFINKCMTEDIYNQSVSKDCLDDESNLKLEKVAGAKGAMKAKVFQQLNQYNQDEIKQIDKSQQQKLKKYIESAVDKFFEPKLAQIPNRLSNSADIKNIWCKYGSIVNISENRVIDDFRSRESINPTKWAVTEKVHGANFALIYNGKEFGAAKFRRKFYRKYLIFFIII